MKLNLVLLAVVLTIKSFGQDAIAYMPTHSKMFILSLISEKVEKMDTLAFGVEHKDVANQTINELDYSLKIKQKNSINVNARFLAMHLKNADAICFKFKNSVYNIDYDEFRFDGWIRIVKITPV
jgi:hypothetical protein